MAIQKILIANRGEIALRIARTCRAMGIACATVHSTADQNAKHVRDIGQSVLIGGEAAADSYLRSDKIVEAALQVGADAVHPGFGFLSENAEFADAVEKAGLIFIGPSPETIELLGHKGRAKELAHQYGVPILTGGAKARADALAAETDVLALGRFPVLLKAAAGGGGRGMRVLRDADGLSVAIESAMREAESAFGSPELIVEPFMENARHIEVQIAGDGSGRAIHLYERECSLQRRHQKVIEEAPAPNLAPATRKAMLEGAVKLAAAVRYRGVGTVEFIISGDAHYFLEVNPRIQVEHPVTEAVTGVDIVQLQIEIANGNGVALDQDAVTVTGASIEARIYAEDPDLDFMPSTGTLTALKLPSPDARIEAGVDQGDRITPFYDPMIAKVITEGRDREEALARLSSALSETVVAGVKTNVCFLSQLIADDRVAAGHMTTDLIDSLDVETPEIAAGEIAIAGAIWLLGQRSPSAADPWKQGGTFTGWRLGEGGDGRPNSPMIVLTAHGQEWPVGFGPIQSTGHISVLVGEDVINIELQAMPGGGYQTIIGVVSATYSSDVSACGVSITGPDRALTFDVVPYLSLDRAGAAGGGTLIAPMMGQILELRVSEGDMVATGDTVGILESMKMEMPLQAEIDGTVAEINCAVGDMIERGQHLMTIETGS